MKCINKSHPEYISLLENNPYPVPLLDAKISIWQDQNSTDEFPSLDQLAQPVGDSKIRYEFKATAAIINKLDKIKEWHKSLGDTDKFWNKLQQDLQIPKDQIQLLKDSYNNVLNKGRGFDKNNPPNLIEEALLDYIANYSYTVEINTAKTQYKQYNIEPEPGIPYEVTNRGDIEEGENTSYYSNLTVPGGTNYTENEISTPDITPSIKGHAQFSTDNGIGWFRSDDKMAEQKKEFSDLLNKNRIEDAEKLDELRKIKDVPTKTRRILEVQSDLFQKGRSNLNLVDKDALSPNNTYDFSYGGYDYSSPGGDIYFKNGEEIPSNEFKSVYDKYFINLNKKKENQFLQLLNKDNNWVTFFIKSIIQDSVKKGYEKVLFPSGNTASKVEGHTTLEEFKREKEGRIKELEKVKSTDFYQIPKGEKNEGMWYGKDKLYNDKRFAESSWNNEINQLKQELERVEKEGFGALKPIYNFYENTVTNILNKTYGKENVKLITDEYGNTWNEVTLPKFQQIQVSVPALNLNYPVNQDQFKNNLNYANISQEHKDGLELLVDANVPTVYLKTTLDDVEQTLAELQKILPAQYIELLPAVTIEDITFQEIAVKNPGIDLLKEEERIPVTSNLLTDAEIFETFSTFFSEGGVRSTRKDPNLDNMMINLLKSYGVDIVKGNDVNVEIDRMITQGIIGEEYRHKVWAFVHLMANGPSKAKVFLKPDGYVTKDLYEEAGHIFMSWLSDSTFNIQGVEFKPWEKPSSGTDYLSLTAYYKARHNEIRNHYLMRINNEIAKIYELINEKATATPERLDELDTLIDTPSNRKLKLLNEFEKNALADRLARIEISGKILGEALEARAEGRAYSTNASNKGISAFFTKWANAFVDFLYWVKSKFTGKEINTLRAALNSKSWLTDVGADAAQIEDYANQMEDLAEQIFGNNTKITPSKDLNFFETIASDHISEIDKLVNSIPEDLRQQQEVIENSIHELLANKFLDRYSDYLQDLSDEAVTQGIPPNLYIALRRLTPDGSARLKAAIDSFKLLSPQDKMLHAEKGVFHILKEALNKQTQFGNKDMGEIYKIFIEEGLKQVIVNNADPALLPTELGNFVKDFNTKLDNILTANIADGDIITSLNTTKYNLYHGEFLEYQRRLKLLDENMAKINLIDAYIGNHKIKEALQLFLFGKTVVKNPGSVYEEKIDIPPLFKELDHINEDVDYRKDQINKALNKAEASGQLQQAALRNWENAGKVPNTPEALAYQAASAQYESDRAKVQYARPSTKQYELSYIKYKYFNEIFKTLNEENNGKLKILSYFPVNKKLEVIKILEDSAEKLKNMDDYFRENDNHFMSEIGKALNTIQKDPANPDNDQKYALDSLVSDSTVAKDIGSLEKLMGAKMNHDPYWAHIVAHFYRLNKYAAIKTYDAFEFVKNSFEKNYEAIRKNRAITEIRKKTHTGSIQELFHEREDGKRTHFMLSPYLHGKLEREQQEYLQEIYKVLNSELEKRGHPGRIPTGNLPYDQEQRNEILQENADPELTDDPDLKEIRKMWRNYKLGYEINFNQPKSEQERDRIIAEKEATLDPFALSQWKRTSMRKYYTVGRNGKTKQHILYLGELAIPSNRQSQEVINLAIPTDTEDVESFPIRLNKTDYINHEFNTLYSDPSFAELYDQMHKMQMEIYSLHQRNATWNRVKAYRTGAFAGGALDIGKRGFSLNLKLAVNRIGDIINDALNISSENEFRIDPNKPQLPLHGVMPFTNKDGSYDADKLSDNYFDIISKYYHSVTQYDVKKKGLPQLEILRDLLKRRIVDAEVKRVKKIGQYGDDKLTLEETLEEKAINEKWAQFIDDAFENHVYEQHTKVNVGDTWAARAYYITKMSALTTWWYLSGNTSSAIAARGQATKELFDMALNKRLMTSKGGILNAMMSIIKLYHKDRLNTVGEYFGNTILSKNTAIDSYLGLSNELNPSIKYSNGLYKLLGDVTGLGVLKYANSRPRRMATERLLQNYKWIAAEGMFMNPSMYHRYLSKNSDVSLKYQDTLDKFELLGNSAYDMLEFKNGRIEATDPNIMNQDRRAQLGIYLTEVHDKIDMADSDPSEFSRGIAGKMLLPLKKWLAKWGKMLFQNKFNAITGTEEKAYFQTIALWLLGGISKKRRDERRSRVNFHDDVREAFYKIISTAVLDAALAQLTLIAAQNAMGDCEGEKIDTWRCWWAAMAASTVARVKAEQGLYSTTNLLTNFDKPIASKQGTQKILDIVSTVIGLPIEAITSNLTGEDGDKPIQAGPYKDKTHGQKALISLLPFIRNPYEFFSPRGQVVRQQLITEQLNQDKIPLISFPGTWNSLIQGPILNKGYKFLYPNTPWEDTYPKVITTEQK